MGKLESGVFLALLTVALLVWPATCAHAQWIEDGAALCTATEGQYASRIVSDGAGGAIVTWLDYRASNCDIYAQRVDQLGMVQWTTDGVALCTDAGSQEFSVPFFSRSIAPDGAGGAIVTWFDDRSGNWDIYVQRVDESGTVQWTTDGVALCTATGDQWDPVIASDGAGGAIVTWWDERGSTEDIYAQHVDASGVVQWTTDGVALCTATGCQYVPTIVSDGAGGAIVAWDDSRSGSYHDVYAQRVDASGVVQWTTDGVALCTATGDQHSLQIASDGAGGAIVTWEDWRSGYPNSDIYAQHVLADGTVDTLWSGDGVSLCTDTGNQQAPMIAPDGAGGAIVTWFDDRSGNWDIYAQRVDEFGMVQWTTDGEALCTATEDQTYPTIAPDDAGGAIVTWEDDRNGSHHDIYTQRVDASGVIQWTTDGVPLCTEADDQGEPTIVSDGAGGAIVTWYDARRSTVTDLDIYAQRVTHLGNIGGDWVPILPLAIIAITLAIVSLGVRRLLRKGAGAA